MHFQRILLVLLLTWALTATFLAIFFAYLYLGAESKFSQTIIYVNVGINYGNGTLMWYNNTRALNKMSAYEVLLLVANVSANVGVYGVYIFEINGVIENENCSWMYAAYDRNDVQAMAIVDSWVYPAISSDKFIVRNGDIIVWVFFNWGTHWPPPLPTSTEDLRR